MFSVPARASTTVPDGIWVAPVSGTNCPAPFLMNTLPDTGLMSSLWPSTGGGGAGAAAVVNVWSCPKVVPAALTATRRTW